MDVEHCPSGYDNPQAWCDWRNAHLIDTGKRWVVGAGGTPFITDDPEWSARHHENERRKGDEERRRHNWRLMHPITEEGYAA